MENLIKFETFPSLTLNLSQLELSDDRKRILIWVFEEKQISPADAENVEFIIKECEAIGDRSEWMKQLKVRGEREMLESFKRAT